MNSTHFMVEPVQAHAGGPTAQPPGGNRGSPHPLADMATVRSVRSIPSSSRVLTKHKLLHGLGPLFGLLLFVVALWVLHHELQQYHYREVVRHVEELPAYRLFLALVLTVMSYFLLTGYDTLALHYIRHPLAYGKVALASFIGYAFSHNMGFSLLSGGSVRYRLYSAWGLSAVEIATVVVFNSLTFWFGILALGGMSFLWKPLVVPSSLRLPFVSIRGLGVIFLILRGLICYSAPLERHR
jgi:phosphatidylglycerol lysyltransferase